MLVAAGIARPRDAGGFCPKTIVSLPFGVQNPTPASAGGIVPTLYSPLLLAASALIVPRLRQLPLCSRPKPPPQYSHRTKTTVEDNQPSPNTLLVVFPLPTTLPKMSIHLIVFPGHFPTPSIAREHPGWLRDPAPGRRGRLAGPLPAREERRAGYRRDADAPARTAGGAAAGPVLGGHVRALRGRGAQLGGRRPSGAAPRGGMIVAASPAMGYAWGEPGERSRPWSTGFAS